MTRLVLTVTLSLLVTYVSGQKNLSGTYQTNFPTYGMFGQTLKLNCDSTAILNFRGDLLNDTSFGKWSSNAKNLILTFDSTLYPHQRYKGQLKYKIKRGRFYLINFTKEQYQELKEKVEQYNKDNKANVQLPSYDEFTKKYGKTMKNHTGKMGVQYLKKVKTNDCR